MKRSRILLVHISLFLLGVISCTAQENIQKLTKEDFFVTHMQSNVQIGFGSSIGVISKELGNPFISIVREDTKRPEWSVLRYSWESIKVEVFKGTGKINRITILDETFLTMRGVKVGDAISIIRARYPKASVDNNMVITYSLPTEDSIWGIGFLVDKGIVNEIVIAREP